MSTPQKYVYEIISFPTSDGYMKDHSLFKPVTDFIGENAPGPIYTGLQLNDPKNRLTGFVGWNALKQHEDFEKQPVYAKLGPLVQPVAAGESQVYHASFEGDEMACFKAPIMELVWITPQPGVKLDEVVKMVKQAVDKANEEASEGEHLHMDGGEHECFGATWGRVLEKDMLVYVAGWSSIEAREEFVKSDAAKSVNKAAVGITVNVRHGHHWHVKQASSYEDVATLSVSYLELSDGRATTTSKNDSTTTTSKTDSGAGSEKPGKIKGEAMYEVIQFPTSEKYMKDHSTFKPVTDFIGQHAPGAIYTGLQEQDPKNRLTGFVGWQSVQQHEDFEKQPVYAELGPLVAPVAAGESVVFHISFEGDELACFNAPVTEFTTITPKEGTLMSDLEPLVVYAAENCMKEVKAGKHRYQDGEEHQCFGVTWGRVVGQDMFVNIAGWSSSKAQLAWALPFEGPMTEEVKRLKIPVREKHHWVRGQAKKYQDIANQSIFYLHLADGRA
ncbi:hypothetical protein PENSPDRAFT_732631 [Peniophora sp. CONT]|nr:hypothetical protein PENSPDRAFT_732631 [Peniophora sp. CONT]